MHCSDREAIVTKIGIFGGTFNPIHKMHINIASLALKQLGLDKVIFITAAIPPHKNGTNIVSGEDRHNMVKLAIANEPKFEASSMEIERVGKSYTFDTLTELRSIYPEDELFFIIGGDSLAYLHKWYRAEEFMKLCTFVVYPRGDDAGKQLREECEWLFDNYGTSCIILDAREMAVSSTEIREEIASGVLPEKYIPYAVAEYIRAHRLYMGMEDKTNG